MKLAYLTALITTIGLATTGLVSAADPEDGPTYIVDVASTDGKVLVSDTPIVSHEWQLRDLALPGVACPNGANPKMVLNLRLTYISDDAILLGCQDNCAWNLELSRIKKFDQSGIAHLQCGKDLRIQVKKANNSFKPKPLRGSA